MTEVLKTLTKTFSRPWSRYFTIRTSQPVNNRYIIDLRFQPSKKQVKVKKQESSEEQGEPSVLGANLKGVVIMCIVMMLMMFAVHCTWVTSNAYSSPSVVLASTNYDG